MPISDINVDGNAQLAIDSDSGDLGLVTELPRVEQSVALHVRRQVNPNLGDPLTDDEIAEIAAAIETGLQNDDDVDEVLNVTVTEIDKTSNTVSFFARTSSGVVNDLQANL